MGFEVVTLETAIASGRNFRQRHIEPDSHESKLGHLWLRFSGRHGKNLVSVLDKSPVRPEILLCTRCDETLGVRVSSVDEWILERNEDELMRDSETILNQLGIKVRKEETV